MRTSGEWRMHGAFVLLTLMLGTVYCVGDGLLRDATTVAGSLIPTLFLARKLARRSSPDQSIALWSLLAASMLFTIYQARVLVAEGIRDEPVASDALSMLPVILAYAGLLVGAVLLIRPYARLDPGGTLDATIIAVSCTNAVFAVIPITTGAAGTPPEAQRALLIVILLTGALFGAVLHATVVAREARVAMLYSALAVTSALVGVIAEAMAIDPQTGQEAWWARLCWIVSFLALGASVTHPTFGLVGRPRPHTVVRARVARVAFLAAALSVAPLLTLVSGLTATTANPILLGVSELMLVPLALVRMATLARTEERTEVQLARLSHLDGLTDRLELAVDRVRCGAAPGVALLFIDLDNFKEVNDVHGHQAGDQLLVAVADRLRAAVRSADFVSRIGGDEFVILLEGDPSAIGRSVVAAIERTLAEPVVLDAVAASSVASIGLATARSGQDVTAAELLSMADAAMYDRKRERREAEVGR